MQAWGSCWTVVLWTACWTLTSPPLSIPTDLTTANQGQPLLYSPGNMGNIALLQYLSGSDIS